MINIFLHGWLHHKNLLALKKYQNIQLFTDTKDIDKCSVIYSPCDYINPNEHPNKIYVFGPHFSVFPDQKFYAYINNEISKNSVYIIPSKWCKDFWLNIVKCPENLIQVLPFGVDTDKFKEIVPINNRSCVFIYFKSRSPDELIYIERFLKNKNIEYVIFDYKNKYDEQDYIQYLQKSKYGIILDAHESQGFAIEEALSCNVPLLVWDAYNMNQEYGQYYPSIPATSIPYWDSRCGDFFHEASELEVSFEKFVNNLDNYKPREYILENLSITKCEEKLLNLIESISK